jgi:hypothetical protein
MVKRFVDLARLWWPRRMAAVLALLSVAWSLRMLASGSLLRDAWGVPALWWMVGVAVVQVLAAVGLWYRQRWARMTTLVFQGVAPLLGLLVAGGDARDVGWWLQQLPHLFIVVLLLLPESRHARAALREPGFEPGDTTPV